VSRNSNKPYLSGRVQQENLDAAVERLRNGGRLLILSNSKRPDKNDPDCALFVVTDQERASSTNGAPPPARPANSAAGSGRANDRGRPSRPTSR
jgi:hypothetical protein